MKILIRFGELMLKGKNQKVFVDKLIRHLKVKFNDLNLNVINMRSQALLEFDEKDLDLVIKRVKEVSGIYSFSVIYEVENDNESVVNKATELLNFELKENKKYTFKIETRRTNKNYALTSLEYTQMIAPLILREMDDKLIVDVKNPEITLNIDLRNQSIYLHTSSIKGIGGFPSEIAGKGLLMLSGGIDSPVAGFLALRQGVALELLHFESTPLTPLESINKVIELAKKLSIYLPYNKIKLHVVPFIKIHETLLNKIDDPYIITIMRRMMYRIAEKFADKNKIDILINGEAIGQVASQTLASLKVLESVTTIPIIRPVATYDKSEIIEVAQKIDTYNISIKPFSDCCSIYVPKNPVINPTIKKSLIEETKFDFEPLINDAVENIKTLIIKNNDEIDLSMHGFTFLESYESLVNNK